MPTIDHCGAHIALPEHLAERAAKWPGTETDPKLNAEYLCELVGDHEQHAAYLVDRGRQGAIYLHWDDTEPPTRFTVTAHRHCPPTRLGVERCHLHAGHEGDCHDGGRAHPINI